MKRIYMDNSATSFPKPDGVTEAMVDYATNCGASAGRGAYQEARDCRDILNNCRSLVAELINAESPECIVFTQNCSHALNIVIRGLLNTAPAGSGAITTAMDHNSVLRPLNALAAQAGIKPAFIACDPDSSLVDPADIAAAINADTKLIACVHASNVTGVLQPIDEVAKIARSAGVPILIDAAQSAGHVPLDVQALGADFIAFPGHKGLLGPLGTGILYIRPGMADKLPTMSEGGTGTVSELAVHPDTMPDKFEVGSHNAIGIAGLAAGVKWILQEGAEKIHLRLKGLSLQFLRAAEDIDGLTVYGPQLHQLDHRTSVFSVSVGSLQPAELADMLEKRFGILTRPGVHCAPLAHQTIGTLPIGTTRLSFGAFTTTEDVYAALDALSQIAAESCCGDTSGD